MKINDPHQLLDSRPFSQVSAKKITPVGELLISRCLKTRPRRTKVKSEPLAEGLSRHQAMEGA
jgi:hypothetical protein